MMSESAASPTGPAGCLKVARNTRRAAANVRWQHPEIPLTIMEEKSLSSKHKESSALTLQHNISNELDGLLEKMSLTEIRTNNPDRLIA